MSTPINTRIKNNDKHNLNWLPYRVCEVPQSLNLNHMRFPRWTLVAACSSALALSACSTGEDLPEPTVTDAADTPDSSVTTATEAAAQATDTPTGPAERDPAEFTKNGGQSYAVTFDAANMCVYYSASGYFDCDIAPAGELPPIDIDPGLGTPPEVLLWTDTGGFETSQDTGGGEGTPQGDTLNPGEQVTIGPFTLKHSKDGAIRGEREGYWFELSPERQFSSDHFTPSGTRTNNGNQSSDLAAAGTECGTVVVPRGDEQLVVATKDGTTCNLGMEIMNQYIEAIQAGKSEGQAGFWTAPNGWGCFARWFFPDEPYSGVNGRLACGAEDPAGNPAKEGSGEVVAMTATERTKVQ